jgi:hypothetical protein
VDALIGWTTRLPGERWRVLAEELERRPWAARVRAGATSRQWGKRLLAARFLSVVATAADAPLLVHLLGDPHPAVHIAAAAALERTADARVVTAALNRLPELGSPVQAYYARCWTAHPPSFHAPRTAHPCTIQPCSATSDSRAPELPPVCGTPSTSHTAILKFACRSRVRLAAFRTPTR